MKLPATVYLTSGGGDANKHARITKCNNQMLLQLRVLVTSIRQQNVRSKM